LKTPFFSRRFCKNNPKILRVIFAVSPMDGGGADKMSTKWNPRHGCRKFSPGCLNCYVCRMDAKFGRDPSVFSLTASYLLPPAACCGGRNKGEYKGIFDEVPQI
jgi:hypothetical protein